ncbi:ABC transporter permease [Rhizobium sp. SYY.PMSO]|uniref:ABC transporter permease n=1 Tax=Rhizobium sp. SYY.PMSO TaxID=3382192 RepID=UPI00399038A7
MESIRTLLEKLIKPLLAPLVAMAIATVVGAILIVLLGRNPLEVYETLLEGGLSGWPNLSVTLQMMTPLLFTGLSVSIAFRAGLWNIGAEGQMLIGAMFAGVAGYALTGLPTIIHLPLCILLGFLGGLIWASIPALLRVYLGVNELVVCLMLNPIALLLTGYLSTRVLKAPGPTNKLPDIAESAYLPSFSIYSQLNAGIVLGIAVCIVFLIFNATTVRGFIWKLIGLNPRFAHYGGINVKANALWVMLVSGGVAGLAGVEQVLGQYHSFYDNFSPGFGFDGIAVAMLANSNPLGVIAASFLFGTLNGGSAVLQMTTGLSKYFVQVLQFIVVLVLAGKFVWRRRPRAPRQEVAPSSVEPKTVTQEI